MGLSKSNAMREVHSNTSLPQETRETSNKQSNFTPKAASKKEQQQKNISRREEIIKIRAKISEKKRKEKKETIAKVNKSKS